MKKNTLWMAIFAAAALLIVSTGVVFAASSMHGRSPFTPEAEGFQEQRENDDRWGPMHGRGSGQGLFGPGDSAMMDEMIVVVSEQTGLSLEEIESRLVEGERLFNIAIDAGLDEETFFNLMAEVRKEFFDDAVENGWITEERRQWMIDRMDAFSGENDEGFPCHQQTGDFSPMFNGSQRGFGRRW